MTRDEQVERVERDRRKREDAALLLLLALTGRARVNVNRAIRTGGDWRRLLYGTLLGDEALDLPGGVVLLALLMADAHEAGVRRVGRLVDVKVEAAETREALVRRYTPRARAILERVQVTIERAVINALVDAAVTDRITADVQAVGGAFRVTGFVEDAFGGAQTEASAAITSAYTSGTGDGYGNPDVAVVLTGLQFWNPMDNRTTQICRKRHGVTLPLDASWWFENYPPLHWGPCRSIVLPVTRNVKFTENPPTYPPPDPGFGRWVGFLSSPILAIP